MDVNKTSAYLSLLLLGPVEDVLCAQHAENGQDLVTAPQVNAGNQHFGHWRLQWELRHLAAQAGQQALLCTVQQHAVHQAGQQ